MATQFSPQQLQAAGAPNMYTPPNINQPPAPRYQIPGTNEFTTNPQQQIENAKQGIPVGMVSVPGVGIVPQGTYGSQKVDTSQPSPVTANALPSQSPIQPAPQAIPQAQAEAIKNIEAPAQTPTGQKMQSTLQQLEQTGGQAPSSAGEARMAVAKATPTPPPKEYKPTQQFMQYGDPIMQQFMQSAIQQQQEVTQKGYTVQSMKAVFANQLARMDEKAVNMKNIIEGTEDDIRAEIGKAGGFATESQVLALTNSRNKDLIRGYNSILQQRQSMEQQMQTQVQLVSLDQQYAKDRYDSTMQLYTMQEKIQSNAKSSLEKLVGNVGYGGLAALYNNDPYALGNAEQVLGLPQGALADPRYGAMLDALKKGPEDPLETEYKELRNARAYIDLERSKKDLVSGGGTITGVTIPGSSKESPQDYGNVIDDVASLLPSTRQNAIKEGLVNSIKGGDYRRTYNQIGNVVEESLIGEAQGKFANYRTDYLALQGLRNAIQKYADGGGNMGLIKGKEEEIKRKLGISSGNASALAVQLWRDFQTYRLNMTGAAFGAAESRDYAAVNPTLGKSLDLNLNVIDGARNQIKNRIDSTIDARISNAKPIRDLAEQGFTLNGLKVTFADGSSMTLPNEQALAKFKKDKGL